MLNDSAKFNDQLSVLRIAFIADTFEKSLASRDVFQLVQKKEPSWVLHNGDLTYTKDSDSFLEQIKETFSEKTMYLFTLGNHDVKYNRAGFLDVCAKLVAQADELSQQNCIVEQNGNSFCENSLMGAMGLNVGATYTRDQLKENPHLVETFDEHLTFIDTYLKPSQSRWKLCFWHYPHKSLRVGFRKTGRTPSDPRLLDIYEACRRAGAHFIFTAHDHYYARSHFISDFHNPDDVVGLSFPGHGNVYTYEPGKSMLFVNGLGGHSVNLLSKELAESPKWGFVHPQDYVYEKPLEDDESSKIIFRNYTFRPKSSSNLIWRNLNETTVNPFGALFCDFFWSNVDCNWENVDGKKIDSFQVTRVENGHKS